jgi:hypothetical protein
MSSFDETYDVGGTFGGGFTAADGACAEQCVCTALNSGLAAIVDALTQIDETIAGEQSSNCEIIGTCQSEIQQLIDDSLAGPAAEIAAAQSEIQGILAMFVETQTAIEGLDLSLADLYALPFATGGGGDQPPPKKTYYGWCDFAGGEALVTDSQVPPQPGMTQVSFGDDEDAVLAEATNTCKTYETVDFSKDVRQDFTPYSGGGAGCDIEQYQSESTLKFISGAADALSKPEGFLKSWGALNALGIEGLNLGNIGSVLWGVVQTQSKQPAFLLGQTIGDISNAIACGSSVFQAGARILGSIDLVKHSTGLDLTEFTQPTRYAMHSQCRRIQLEPKDALEAYLSDGMDETQFDTHCAIAGICDTAAQWMIDAGKSKPEVEQAIMMRHRELIDEDEYTKLMRQLGYLDPQQTDLIFRISEHLPDIGTVTKILQSGATDDGQAEKLGLDRGVEALESGQLADWIKGNGIAPETAKAFWRAHWQTPGVNTLIELYHRLRDDTDFNSNGELEDDISTAMDTLGIPLYWQERILATALSPLLKRDIRVAYTSGALPDDELGPALRKTGHDDDAVATIIKELKPARRHALLGHIALRNWVHQQINGDECSQQLSADGFDSDTIQQAMKDAEFDFASSSWSEAYLRGTLPKADLVQLLTDFGVTENGAEAIATKLSFRIIDHQPVRDYQSGSVARSTAQQQMSDNGMYSSVIAKLLDDADATIDNDAVKDCLRGVKSQYVTGGIDNEEARSILAGFNVDSKFISQSISSWDCQRKADGKDIAVEKLCGLLYIGAIDQTDMYQRLIRLGYSEANAALLMVDCVNANTLKAVKQQQAMAKEVQRGIDAEKRAIDKVNAANQRQADRLAKMRSDQAKLRGNRQKQYISASEKVYKASSTDLQTALQTVRSSMDAIKSAYGLNEDEALKLAILAADEMKGSQIENYKPLLEGLAAAAAAGEPTPTPEEIGIAPSSNGSTQPS